MDTHEKQEKQRQARRRLSAQRSRAGFLRGRVIAASILCFGLIWAVVFVQMATGNDPVLSAKAQATGTTQLKKRHRAAASRAASEAIETTEPRELESEPIEEPVEGPEVVEEPEFGEEPEVIEEPEPELEPLTTGQS
jgi:hypothetical protein